MNSFIKELEAEIEKSYSEGVTLEEAERLAGKFLVAQLQVSRELQKADLDSRMRKTGVKAIRSAVYLNIVKNAEKKPTESQIEATINVDDIVSKEQESFDIAESSKAELERIFDVLINAHIFFRSLSKGRFE